MSRLIHKARRDFFVVVDSLSEAKEITENQFSHIRLSYVYLNPSGITLDINTCKTIEVFDAFQYI